MMATINHGNSEAAETRQRLPSPLSWPIRLVAVGVFAVLLAVIPRSAKASEVPSNLVQRVEQAYREAREKSAQSTNDVQLAWQLGRACFDWADLARTDAQRKTIAEEGIAACRRAAQLDPKSAPAQCYLALNLGQLAQTKLLGALPLLDEMEQAFLKAIALDSKFNHAAAHCFLGQLYRQAPGWPASIGDRTKARFHLEKSVELAPDFPGACLRLLEARIKWGDNFDVKAQLEAMETLLQKARQQFSGDDWALAWIEWDEIWARIKAALAHPRIESPRSKK